MTCLIDRIPKWGCCAEIKTRIGTGVLLALLALLTTGCGISSEVYREGAIQSAYNPRTTPLGESTGRDLDLVVKPFSESRRTRREKQALWLCALPVGSLGAYWKRPDWLLWEEPHYAAYKSAGEDVAEVLAREFRRSGLFRSVRVQQTDAGADLVVEGDVQNLTLTLRPHFLGTSIFVGHILGQLGAPMGNWSVEQSLDIRLSEASSAKVLWENTFQTNAGGLIAAYYGGDPMRCGYPAEPLIAPVVEKTLQETQRALAAHPPHYWEALASAGAATDQPDPPSFEPTTPVTPRPVARDTASVGVVIGISDYAFMGDIEVCASDAKTFASALTEERGIPAENVAVMTDDSTDTLMPSREMIRERVRICAREAKEGGLAFLYFSGHAVTREQELLLVPKDCRPPNGIPLAEIIETLSESEAEDRILVVDACHAGAARKGVEGLRPDLVELRSDVTVFLSCDRDQFSYPETTNRHSVYTHRFVQALRTLSNRNESVTADALHAEIKKLMRRWRLEKGKAQNPQLIQPSGQQVVIIPARK